MATSTLTAEDLLESLTRVVDPEIGVNIVDLGLVYGIDLARDVATIQMTMRSKDSLIRSAIESDIQLTLGKRHPDLLRIHVDLVWEPAWQEHFMTEEGRHQRDFPIVRHVATPESPLNDDDIFDSLRFVLDPEVGINIVDLGLVYGVTVRDNTVSIEMTMTTRACPLQETIEGAVNRTLGIRHPELTKVVINVVWEPAWDVERISAVGRTELGW